MNKPQILGRVPLVGSTFQRAGILLWNSDHQLWDWGALVDAPHKCLKWSWTFRLWISLDRLWLNDKQALLKVWELWFVTFLTEGLKHVWGTWAVWPWQWLNAVWHSFWCSVSAVSCFTSSQPAAAAAAGRRGGVDASWRLERIGLMSAVIRCLWITSDFLKLLSMRWCSVVTEIIEKHVLTLLTFWWEFVWNRSGSLSAPLPVSF